MYCAYLAKVPIMWSGTRCQGIIMLKLTGVVIVGLDVARFKKNDSKVGWGCPCFVRSCRSHYRNQITCASMSPLCSKCYCISLAVLLMTLRDEDELPRVFVHLVDMLAQDLGKVVGKPA